MKIISKNEWDRVPENNKKIYDLTPYMVYKDTDGSTCFGPVKITEENTMVNKKELLQKSLDEPSQILREGSG